MGGPVDPNSFVQTELRKEAMRLHTRDQSKEGEQEAQTPFTVRVGVFARASFVVRVVFVGGCLGGDGGYLDRLISYSPPHDKKINPHPPYLHVRSYLLTFYLLTHSLKR
jgi:hypothetical protein